MHGGPFPHEFAIGGVLMPPLLVATVFGILAAIVTALLLNRWRFRLARRFFYPPLVILSLVVIYTGFIGVLFFGV